MFLFNKSLQLGVLFVVLWQNTSLHLSRNNNVIMCMKIFYSATSYTECTYSRCKINKYFLNKH